LYIKSLAVFERQRNRHEAATVLHHLGAVAPKREDFGQAEMWYVRSLAIKEMQRDEHGAACTYGDLGVLAGKRKNYELSAQWFLKAIRGFELTSDPENRERTTHNFMFTYQESPAALEPRIRRLWEEANVGPFPAD